MTGLVLAGGLSSRMGFNKALIEYHNLPQYLHVANLVNKYCKSIFISSNTVLDAKNIFIQDNKQYHSLGPIAGLLSAYDNFQDDYFVVAIDYVFLQQQDLDCLWYHYSRAKISSAMYNNESNFYEPFIAIYSKVFIEKLIIESLNQMNFSLQKYLQLYHINKTILTSNNSLKSIDTFEEYQSIIQSKK